MYYDEDYRVCAACRKWKRVPSEMWWDARRCRKCIGRERSERAKKRRETEAQWEAEYRQEVEKLREQTENELDLKLSVPPRRLLRVDREAREEADATVPETRVSPVYAGLTVGCFATAIVAMIGLMAGSYLLAFALPAVVFVVTSVIAGALSKAENERIAKRDAAVRKLAAKKLREKLEQIDAEQFEYRRFYGTSDWREIRDAVMERDGEVCRLCGSREDLTVDHILPRSRYPDRALDPENLQVLCRSCNAAKGTQVKGKEQKND